MPHEKSIQLPTVHPDGSHEGELLFDFSTTTPQNQIVKLSYRHTQGEVNFLMEWAVANALNIELDTLLATNQPTARVK